MMPLNQPSTKKSFLETFPQLVLMATGIIYASGFLVVLAFLDRYGIRESGAELWKARYVHIGILCLSFPVILNGTILSLTHLIFNGKFDKPAMWQRIFPIALLIINIEIIFYVFIMITNKNLTGAISGIVPAFYIFLVTILGVFISLITERLIERKIGGKSNNNGTKISPHGQSFAVTARWVLVLIVAGLDVWFFSDFTATNFEAKLGIIYIVFCILFGIIISTAIIYMQRQAEIGRRRAVAIFSFSIIAPLSYILVLSFSYSVFQNIPATRGGGDYTDSPKVTVTFKEKPAITSVDAKYFDVKTEKSTIPLVLIEETSSAFYLADPKENGGATEWKQIGGRKPNIFIANKAEISRLYSESRNQNQ